MRPWRLHLAGRPPVPVARPLVMGILNATPDSFSDGGRLATSAAAQIQHMVSAGADLLDVGAESTRPGFQGVPASEQVRRLGPVLAPAVATGLPVSIDTRSAEVAKWALGQGAHFVNDVSGLGDSGMGAVAVAHGCSVVLMRSAPLPGELLQSCRQQLADLIGRAQGAGLQRDRIVLDPGIGFGDPPGGDPGANLALLRGVATYDNGLPVLVGASRKRFIGQLSGVPEPERRVAGSVAAAIVAVQAGAAIVRVHDVAETVQALRVIGHA